MSKAYRYYVRELSCCVTGDIGFNDPHHITGYNWLTGKGMGKKGSDLTCISLRHDLHQELHQIGWKSWEQKHNVSQLELMIKTILKAERDGVINV